MNFVLNLVLVLQILSALCLVGLIPMQHLSLIHISEPTRPY